MSTTVLCPHCRGKLRLHQSSAPRVRCRLCGKGFDNPAATAVSVEVLGRPLNPAAPAEAPPPAAAPAKASGARPAPPVVVDSPPVVSELVDGRFAPDPILTVVRAPGASRAAALRRLRARHAARFRADHRHWRGRRRFGGHQFR